MRHPSVMQHAFSMIPSVQIQRSSFRRNQTHKTTFNAGLLVPFYVDEIIPGDTFTMNASIFARLATPLFPTMDVLTADTFFFFVPLRLIHENFQRMMGEKDNPADTIDYLVPQITPPSGGWQPNSLEDYFGLPTLVEGISVSAYWHRAYNLIWNEWFRAQDFFDSVPFHKDDGPDDPSDYTLLRRVKRHDYFTSCLPAPQRGPGVAIGLAGEAQVRGSFDVSQMPIQPYVPTGLNFPTPRFHTGTSPTQVSYIVADGSIGGGIDNVPLTAQPYGDTGHPEGGGLSWFDPALRLQPGSGDGLVTGVADLSTALAITINQYRQGFQIQRLLERDARGGTRYTEILRSHFGVISPDARLQRPEYLGGGSQRVLLQPVAQTGSTDTVSPQGNLAAFGVLSSPRNGFSRSFVEHGVILGLINVRADLTYQQGIDRMFSRKTRLDFYWPAFAHLGEQAVLMKEIYATGTADDTKAWGYQEPWAEYRYGRNKITGLFRSNHPQSMDAWTYSQHFATAPALNSEFLIEDPPIARTIAVPSEPHFICDVFMRLTCARPMPMFGVPGLIDHF